MAEGKVNETLVAFESGHYKKVTGKWDGDSVWCHFKKEDGGMVHINKDKVEYTESFGEQKKELIYKPQQEDNACLQERVLQPPSSPAPTPKKK